MLLTITTTHQPATELGFLLHKHPARVQTFELSHGKAHVFYPRTDDSLCTVALIVDVDPIGLVRGRKGPPGEGGALEQYVNDRPYVASSFLSVAISHVFGTAMAGKCAERPDLAVCTIPLEATIAVLPCRGGEAFLRRLFEPLGYSLDAVRHPLDEAFPEWGEGPYHTITVRRTCRLSELLTHLYVLVPVLDNDKHYWVGDAEVDKLLRHGEGWLSQHPERDAIVARYLKHQSQLTRAALARLVEDEPDPDAQSAAHDAEEEQAVEQPLSLNEQRLGTVTAVLASSGARSVIDLGCGEGRLIRRLLEQKQFERVVGMDVSVRALEIAAQRLRLERLPDRQRGRVSLMQGSVLYRDDRLAGFDAATIIEVIEHLDPPRLRAFERVVFEFARPGIVVATTPNVEYNVLFEGLEAGVLRHRDHRFEWTRAEFRGWAESVAVRHGYAVRFAGIGPEDAAAGPPTQMGVFTR